MEKVATTEVGGADVVTALRKVGGEGMAGGVAAGTLVDAGRADGAGHGALHVRLSRGAQRETFDRSHQAARRARHWRRGLPVQRSGAYELLAQLRDARGSMVTRLYFRFGSRW